MVSLLQIDHQLIEQIDDQFTRMKESGDIAAIQKRWAHPEDSIPEAQPIALYIAKGLLGKKADVQHYSPDKETHPLTDYDREQ